MQREFIEGNKLIAAFMDYEYTPSPVPIPKINSGEKQFGWTKKMEWFPWYRKSMDESDFPLKRYHLARTNDDLKFHYYWEWIMPVVCKIKGLLEDNDLYNAGGKKHWDMISIAMETTEILAIRTCVIAFIKWHNQQSQTKTQNENTKIQ